MPNKAPFRQVKLIIRMNQADSASIRKGIFPKRGGPVKITSIGLPVKALTARMEVANEFNKTKKKLAVALKCNGKSGKRINPIPVTITDEKIN